MNNEKLEVATLGGGCFWCLEAVYQELEGVVYVESGYSGGHVPNPTYEEVCLETTGHAEVVRVHFDPEVVSFQEILEVFFAIHDPTTLNRQGADFGSQYRSVIFYHSPEQKAEAERMLEGLDAAGIWSSPIVTEVAAFEDFYRAEDYHQDFYLRDPNQPYCQVVIDPKLAEFRSKFSSKLKEPSAPSG